jgi:hypothetical protein
VKDTTGAYGEGVKSQPNNGILEFSMEAIDALATENKHHDGHRAEPNTGEETSEAPLRSLMKDMPRRKERFQAGASTRTLFRRVDTEGANFKASPDVRSGKRRDGDDWTPPPREHWMIDKESLKRKFPGGYQPLKRLSPDAVAGIRALHAQMPEQYTTWALSQEFEVSPEAIRRILKSKWRPDLEEESDRARRWLKRGEKVWSRYAELGVKPPRKWRDQGIGKGKPEWMLRRSANFKYEAPELPALITTTRQPPEQASPTSTKHDLDSLADRIL